MSRYKNRLLGFNNNDLYNDQFQARDIVSIDQYVTPTFIYPDSDTSDLLSFVPHTWAYRDKYYLLAHRYYNDPQLWWIIAQYNQAPTEQHLIEGQIVKIPYPLSAVYNYLGQE